MRDLNNTYADTSSFGDLTHSWSQGTIASLPTTALIALSLISQKPGPKEGSAARSFSRPETPWGELRQWDASTFGRGEGILPRLLDMHR